MGHRLFLLTLPLPLLLWAGLSTAPSTVSQDPAVEQDPEVMMAEMAKLAAPGPEHKVLDDLAGTFDATVTWWMAPDAPPNTSSGTMTSHWILGGRYLQGDYSSEFMGAPFSGLSLTGYDNAQGIFQSTWLDTMGTGMMPTSSGHRDGNRITFDRDMFDPMQGKIVHEREVITIESHEKNRMEMYMIAPDGTETKTMVIAYSRTM